MTNIGDLGRKDALGVVTVRARVMDMFYSPQNQVYLSVADSSGRILVRIMQSISQAVYVGSIVSIHGSVMLRDERIMINAMDILKLQEVEDGFKQLATISVQESDLPPSEGDRWVKPNRDMERIQSAVFNRRSKSEYAIIGLVLICLAFFPIPILSCVFCVAGILLIVAGLLTQTTSVTSVEKASISKILFSLLLSHHTADKLHRCIHVKVGSHELHLCARCTGSAIGLAVGMLLIVLLPSVGFPDAYAIPLAVLLALPALVDWSTQRLALRESSSAIRLLTGGMVGVGAMFAMNLGIMTRLFLTIPFLFAMALVWLASEGAHRNQGFLVLK